MAPDPCTKICTKTEIRSVSRDHRTINKNNALGAVFRLSKDGMAERQPAIFLLHHVASLRGFP